MLRGGAKLAGPAPARSVGYRQQAVEWASADAGRHYRSARRRLAREVAALSDLVSDHTSPSKAAIRNEGIARLQEALEVLPADQRRAIELHHLQGLSLREAGQEMGRTWIAVAALGGLWANGVELERTVTVSGGG